MSYYKQLSVTLCNTSVAVQSCSETQYQCQDKSGCIPSTQKCDGVKHCPDSSDETPPTCTGGGEYLYSYIFQVLK